MKALVIENNRASRILLEKILTLQGLEVFQTGKASEGFDIYRNNEIDIVILNLELPKEDPIQLIRDIRDIDVRRGNLSYLIVATSDKSESNETRILNALEEGANEFLIKPYDTDNVKERIILCEKNNRKLPLDAVSILTEEHKVLLRMIRILEVVSRQIEKNGVSKKVLDWCNSTAFILDTRVHHQKEDHFVVSFLERAMSEEGEQPKSNVFSRASLKTIEDEHHTLLGFQGQMQAQIAAYIDKKLGAEVGLKIVLDDYISLIKDHMVREERFMFPVSRHYLTEKDNNQLLFEFGKIEREVGVEKIDKRLKQILNIERYIAEKHPNFFKPVRVLA